MTFRRLQYLLIASYLGLSILNYFYFFPKQAAFYLDSDITALENRTGIAWLQLIFTAAALGMITLHKRINLLPIPAKVIITVLLIFLGTSKGITTLALYSNRLSATSVVYKNYKVDCLAGSPLTKQNFFLWDLQSNKKIDDLRLLQKVYNDQLHAGDIISVPFTLGRWNMKTLKN